MKHFAVSLPDFVWVIEACCSLLQLPYQRELILQQFAAPHDNASVTAALAELGITAQSRKLKTTKLGRESFPLLVWLKDDAELHPALILRAEADKVLLVQPGDKEPRAVPLSELAERSHGTYLRLTTQVQNGTDPDGDILRVQGRRFGFSWFVPELLKHKKLWQEILLASLVIQLLALATPLFTQTIIDKVIVNRTQSTLVVVLIGMMVFVVFTTVLSWLRQYLVLHTGNRVDAVLGSAVFERLFKLPPLYFQHRPTGVISARLHGVETIREFIASTAVTLILDFPFLLIFVAIMLYYSVALSAIVLGVMLVIAMASFVVAPLFQKRLQEQFQMGARNQAFVTEYVGGMETVKSLQLEPQLASRYRGYLATYLTSGFATKQLANTYNSFAQMMEQIMNLLILGVGAWMVMHNADFTIGMLVAFQMFASRVSQPMLRLVGLWQQFQQASLSVDRLGDLMNAPIEPYTLSPKRLQSGHGAIELDNLAFRYSDKLPFLYQNLSAKLNAGQTIAIMGPSGSGKSTLAKMLQGFYQPTEGRIRIDGVDIANLSANELRSHFGVVPQETTLFSGTILDNLQMANPQASFEQIVTACKMAEVNSTIESLPDGYQTEIGERGAGLSGGQRQRIAIARALLKRPKILVFDEATSALDAPTAEQFAKTINALRGKVTMLFITHGLPRGLKVDVLYQLTANGLDQVSLSGDPSRDSSKASA
ncbi:peptidase domain-containing ABC transporter [Rhodoferax sp.]|uniref:peptidase domain-containing ABC transporter n=1 Tax=Rhodoferax sp. TaxID=50421 RepID=UPI001EBFA9A0|nr:peptidase domain-containing ABC transporter [Rhodoferax sp.]MBT9508250.1 peptidase domain-containing ABC transporter [Rhodoferax sp.]